VAGAGPAGRHRPAAAHRPGPAALRPAGLTPRRSRRRDRDDGARCRRGRGAGGGDRHTRSRCGSSRSRTCVQAHGERHGAYAARTGRFLPLLGRVRR
jgi:hypothetical protein